MRIHLLWCLIFLGLSLGCTKERLEPIANSGSDDQAAEGELPARFRSYQQAGGQALKQIDQSFLFSSPSRNGIFTYDAWLRNVEQDSTLLQATDVFYHQPYLFVSFADEGPDFRGAIAVYDLSTPQWSLVEELNFLDSEWHTLHVEPTGALYTCLLGGARDPAETPHSSNRHNGAILAKLEFDPGAASLSHFQYKDYHELGLTGQMVHTLVEKDGRYLIAAGNRPENKFSDLGAVFEIAPDFKNSLDYYSVIDAQGVAFNPYSQPARPIGLMYRYKTQTSMLLGFKSFEAFNSGKLVNEVEQTYSLFDTLAQRPYSTFWNSDSTMLAAMGVHGLFEFNVSSIDTARIWPLRNFAGQLHQIQIDQQEDWIYAALGDGGADIIANRSYAAQYPGYKAFQAVYSFPRPTKNYPEKFSIRKVKPFGDGRLAFFTNQGGVLIGHY